MKGFLGWRRRKLAAGADLQDIPLEARPEHVAIIMDGNGRWARKRLMPRRYGHRHGADNLRTITSAAADLGVKYLTVYAFSTENWSRPREEVDALMRLVIEFCRNLDKEMEREGVRLRFIGRRDNLPPEVLTTIEETEQRSSMRKRIQLIVALNYGGRDELVQATRALAKATCAGEIDLDTVNENSLAGFTYMPDVPDPDLLIRTGGEQRLSNFLLWQSAYTEFIFTPVLWPDFRAEDLTAAVRDFAGRQRRFGGHK